MASSASAESFALEKSTKVEIDRPKLSVESWMRALTSSDHSSIRQYSKKRGFLLVAAICVKEFLDLRGNFGESQRSLRTLGEEVLGLLKKGQPLSLTTSIAKELAEVKSVQSTLHVFSRNSRSQVIKKAVGKGKSYFNFTAERLRGSPVQTIECCKDIETGKTFLTGLLNVSNGSPQAKEVSRFEEALHVELNVWRYWSFYDTCLKHFADHGKNLAKTVTPSNSIDACISALETLRNWVESNLKTLPSDPGSVESTGTIDVVAQEPSSATEAVPEESLAIVASDNGPTIPAGANEERACGVSGLFCGSTRSSQTPGKINCCFFVSTTKDSLVPETKGKRQNYNKKKSKGSFICELYVLSIRVLLQGMPKINLKMPLKYCIN